MDMRYFFIALLLAATIGVIPSSALAESTASDALYRATLIQLIETLQLQIIELQEELDRRTEATETAEFRPEAVADPVEVSGRFSDTVAVAQQFTLTSERDIEDIPYLDTRRYFEYLFFLYPDEYDERISEIIVFNDDGRFFDAFVETVPPRHDTWAYAINSDVVGDPLDEIAAELMVHELAHIVGYDAIPGVPLPANTDCHPYFERTGCPAENSYLAAFTERFWSEADLARAETYFDTDDLIDTVEEFYETNELDYVTAYAASSPEEDFAESFMFYILGQRAPDGGEAAAKTDFFGEYEVMRDIRREIRGRL